jgi:hypothetical protein
MQLPSTEALESRRPGYWLDRAGLICFFANDEEPTLSGTLVQPLVG